MSVDPSTVIVAVAAALGGVVHGSDAPPTLKDFGTQQVQTITDSAPAIGEQINEYIELLPQQSQGPAQQAVTDLAGAVQSAVDPYLPAAPESAPIVEPPADEPSPQSGPATDSRASEKTPDTSGPVEVTPSGEPFTGYVPSPGHPSLIADFYGPTTESVGAIAVFIPWFQKAGDICAGINAPTLAALYAAENGFRYGTTAPVSPDGAQGPGQFMPGTWARYGKDADGDGRANILDVADSVMASGHLLCDMYSEIEDWKKHGIVSGDTLDLTIAGYNAGIGAVRRSGGMPSGLMDYENQTKPYVAKIRATEPRYKSILGFRPEDFEGIGNRVVEAALRYLGLPYVWGGGDKSGPSGGGFDCSGLTSYAVYSASDAGFSLPRTSETQWNIGVEVPLADAKPGDLLFGNWGPGGPGHVAIYIGNGQMVHAPTTGDVVRIAPVFDGMKVRRVM